MNEAQTIAAPGQPMNDAQTVPLDHPLKRGETEIAAITLTQPKVRALRGIDIADVLRMNTDAIVTLLPRISELTPHEVEALHPADFVSLATAAAGFFVARRFQPEGADS